MRRVVLRFVNGCNFRGLGIGQVSAGRVFGGDLIGGNVTGFLEWANPLYPKNASSQYTWLP